MGEKTMLVEEINLKVVILGDGGVGKTSLINSFLEKSIPKMYVPTIGSNIARKEHKINDREYNQSEKYCYGRLSFFRSHSEKIPLVFLAFMVAKPLKVIS